MKKLLLILIFIPALSFSQLTNGNFENIETITLSNGQTYQKPVGWCYAWEGNYGTEITSDSYQGNYAMKLWSWYFMQSNEQLHYGESPYYAVPFTNRPEKLKGYYKFTNPNIQPNGIPDSAYVYILMTSYNQTSNVRDTISFTEHNLGEQNSYTNFEIDLNYVSAQNPDSLQLYFRTSYFQGPSDNTSECNYLYLDNLSFENNTMSTNEVNESTFYIHPNPTNGKLSIHSKEEYKSIKIISANGRQIKEFFSIEPKSVITIDIQSLNSGLYFIQLIGINEKILITKKIIKN